MAAVGATPLQTNPLVANNNRNRTTTPPKTTTNNPGPAVIPTLSPAALALNGQSTQTPVPAKGVGDVIAPDSSAPSPLLAKMQRLFDLNKTLTIQQLKGSENPAVRKLAAVLDDASGDTKISRAEFAKALASLNENFTIKGEEGFFNKTPAADSNNFLNFFFQHNDISSKGFDQALRDIDLTYKIYGGEKSERSVSKDFHHKGTFRAINSNKLGGTLQDALGMNGNQVKAYVNMPLTEKDSNLVVISYGHLKKNENDPEPSWDDIATLVLIQGKGKYLEGLRDAEDKEVSSKSKKIDQAMADENESDNTLKDIIKQLAVGNRAQKEFGTLLTKVQLKENDNSFFSFLSSPFTSKP